MVESMSSVVVRYTSMTGLIFMRINARKVDDRVSLASVLDLIGQVRLQYIVRGKEMRKKLDSRDPGALKIAEKLDLISVA